MTNREFGRLVGFVGVVAGGGLIGLGLTVNEATIVFVGSTWAAMGTIVIWSLFR